MFNLFNLFNKNPLPKSFKEEFGRIKLASRSYQGIKTIPTDKIVGTVQRSHKDWKTLKKTKRYEQIKEAAKNMVIFPPIKVYQIKDEYYIEDGHHRVLAYKEIGKAFIDAEVIKYKFTDKMKIYGNNN